MPAQAPGPAPGERACGKPVGGLAKPSSSPASQAPNQAGSQASRAGQGPRAGSGTSIHKFRPQVPTSWGARDPTQGQVLRYLTDTQLTPASVPSVVQAGSTGQEDGRPCCKSLRKETGGITYFLVAWFSTTKGSKSNSRHPSAKKPLPSFLGRVGHPCFLLRPSPSGGQRNHSEDGHNGKRCTQPSPCASVSPFLRLTSFLHAICFDSLRAWTTAPRENPGIGWGLFPVASGSPLWMDQQSSNNTRPSLGPSGPGRRR